MNIYTIFIIVWNHPRHSLHIHFTEFLLLPCKVEITIVL